MKNNTRIFYFVSILVAVIILWQTPQLVDTAVADLPPRPTVEPTPTSEPSENERRPGATIELHAPAAPADTWTVVQWRDAQGDWHDVDGWQGYLDDGEGVKRWWVAPADFQTGPFRWVLAETRGGEVQETSVAFDLPQRSHQVVVVVIE